MSEMDKKSFKLKDDKNSANKKEEKKDVKKKDSGKKKERFSLVKKFREMVAELKKVTWPSRKELIRSSIVVAVFVVSVTIVIALYDLILTNLIRLII